MIVTYRDKLGVVSVKINTEYGVTFGASNVFFTDICNNDYKIKTEHIISITKAE